LPWPTYTSEYTGGARAVAEEFAVPALLASGSASPAQARAALARLSGHHMLKAAFELALLDAALRARETSLAAYLRSASSLDEARGPVPATVPAGVVVGFTASSAELLAEVERFVALGYRRVKLKVAPGRDTAELAEVRRRWPELVLMADGNGAYAGAGPAQAARQLRGLEQLGLACLEQPLAPDDLLGHARLARQLAVPLALDEALSSPAAVALALELGACSVVNVKAGRLGGYLAAVEVHDLCARAGAAAWCGGMVETGIGRAANVALGSLPGFSLPGDISASSRFFATDVAGPLELAEGGTVMVPTGPGLGVAVDVAAVARFSVRRSWHPAR
jgi:O-succinylbenzoate synthase